MKLSDHFSLNEATLSNTAVRLGINNTPPTEVLETIILTADRMEKVREILDKPIIVSSWYRSPELNRRVKGSSKSHHMLGVAVDFVVTGMTVKQVIDKINKSSLDFDQLINEFNRWVHISFHPNNRRQVFRIG